MRIFQGARPTATKCSAPSATKIGFVKENVPSLNAQHSDSAQSVWERNLKKGKNNFNYFESQQMKQDTEPASSLSALYTIQRKTAPKGGEVAISVMKHGTCFHLVAIFLVTIRILGSS